jgi:hypothetical protein
VPKFQQLLCDQYPDEKAAIFLQRLTKMWDLHKRERRFGLTCLQSCDCEEFWGIGFRRGDVLGEMATVASRKRQPTIPAAPEPRVPRKRSRTDSFPGNNKSSGTSGHHYVAKAPSLLPSPHLPDGGTKGAAPVDTRKQGNLKPALNQPGRFSLPFRSDTPLGFYSMTERTMTSTVCTIASIDPLGACQKMNAHIRKGTRGKHCGF